MSTLDLRAETKDIDEPELWRRLNEARREMTVRVVRVTEAQRDRLRACVRNPAKFEERDGALMLDTPYGRVTLEVGE